MKPIPCNRFWFCLVVIVPALWAFLALHMTAHAQNPVPGVVICPDCGLKLTPKTNSDVCLKSLRKDRLHPIFVVEFGDDFPVLTPKQPA